MRVQSCLIICKKLKPSIYYGRRFFTFIMINIEFMKKIEEFIAKHYQKIVLLLLVIIFFNTCGNPNKQLTKKVEILSTKIDSLEMVTVTKKDLTIEGLKVEKRLIQSTDRNILDVNRQSQIDKELENLSK
jgi:hypothetical protein